MSTMQLGYMYGGVVLHAYKYTGKERDTESGLDNFGARYDSSSLGRFMTPDWAARPTAVPYAVFGDPQSLNLYGYVRNDPVSRADADGHQAGVEADAFVNRGDTSPFSYGLFGMAFTMWQTTTQSQEIAKMEAFLAQARQRGDVGGPQQQTASGCQAQMRSRPGDITSLGGYGASHAWWWVVDNSGQDHTLSFTMNVTWTTVPTPVGSLPVPNPPVLNAYAADGPQSSSNKNDNLQHGTVIFDTKGPSACSGVSKMIDATKNFPKDQVPYGRTEGNATSNSGARYLGAVGGFKPPMPDQPGLRAVGWDLRIPGVEH